MSSKAVIQLFTSMDDRKVTKLQNNLYVGMLSFILTTLFSKMVGYLFNGTHVELDSIVYAITIHCALDMFLCKNEMLLHHVCVIMMSSFMYTHNVKNINVQLLTLISTEVSTVFFTAMSILNDMEYVLINEELCVPTFVEEILKRPRIIVERLFVSTFFVTRVCLYSKNLIFNKEFNAYMITNYTNTLPSFIQFYGANYVLYFLNMYWFMIIVKKLFKNYKNMSMFHPKNVQRIIRYTYFFQNAIVLWSYSPFKYAIYYLDVFGNLFLSCSSYMFHNSIYEKLIENEKKKSDGEKNEDNLSVIPVSSIDVDRLDNDIIEHYIVDVCFIELRMVLSIFVNINPLQILHENSNIFTSENTYFLYKMNLYVFTLSLMNCVLGLYNYCKFILTLKINNVVFPYFHDKTNVVTTSMLVGLTMASTLLVVLYNTTDFDLRNEMFVVSVILTLTMYTQPFYQVSYLVTHMFLIYQTKLFCDANVFTNNGYFNEYALVEF